MVQAWDGSTRRAQNKLTMSSYIEAKSLSIYVFKICAARWETSACEAVMASWPRANPLFTSHVQQGQERGEQRVYNSQETIQKYLHLKSFQRGNSQRIKIHG
jgi:hypothetical protein